MIAVGVLALACSPEARASGITNAGSDLRTGWYPENPTLTPQLVSGGSFGRLWTANVDGQVYAQPLYDNGTVLVATENDWAYGLDATTGAQKWSRSLGTPWNPADIGCGDLTPSIGTTATPVIDPTTNTAYLTHKTYAAGSSGAARWFMDAIDMSSGNERPGFPVELSGKADNQPSRTFSPTDQQQRPGLLLMEGVVYAAFGSHCDYSTWQGWIFGVSTAGNVTARYVDNAAESGAGIWQSGAGLTSDGPGTILFSTGNGGAPSKPTAGSSPPPDLGESVVRVRVQPDGSLKAVDFFAPFDAVALDEYDADFASGGVTALPNEYFGTASVPHLAVAVGKAGYVYLLNRDSLGGMMQGPEGGDKVVQRIGPRGGVWSRPGVWPGEGGYVYIPTSSGSPAGGYLDVYKYGLSGTGQPSLALVGSSEDAFGWGSGAPVITSNGVEPGSALVWIVWSANRQGTGGQLRAYDPVPVGGKPVLRYQSSIGVASNYSTPGVGGGRLYIGNREGKVLAYGSPVKPPLSGPSTTFPTTTVGKSNTKTLTLTANEAVTITKLSSDASQFAIGSPTPPLPASLSPGQTITIPITFTPTQAGPAGGSLSIDTGGGESPQFALSGTGQLEGPHLSVAPGLVAFPGAAVHAHETATVTFSNDGGSPLKITEVKAPPPPFEASGLPSVGTELAPGKSVTVEVAFAPTEEGTFLQSLALKSTGGEAKAVLSGEAGSPPSLRISQEAISFGSVVLGSAATRSFTISNVGGTAANITKSKPPDGGAFTAVTELPEGATIQPGESLTEQVSFAPSALGPASGTWEINGDDTSGLHALQFSGSGVLASSGTSSPAPQGGVLGAQLVVPLVAPSGPDVELVGVVLHANSRGQLAVRLRCPASQSVCRGVLALTTRPGLTASGRKAWRKAHASEYAHASFSLLGGREGTVVLRLSARTRATLRHLGALRLRVVLTAHGASGATHTTRTNVVVRAAR